MLTDTVARTETLATNMANPPSGCFSAEEVSVHHTADDCWVICDDKVYNVTAFLEGHPGGEDLILMNGGKDVTNIMRDPVEHDHSEFAFSMLEEYYIGTLKKGQRSETSAAKDPSLKNMVADPNFLDISKPLFPQMWRNNFSKQYYLEQVHIARHIKDGSPAPIFGGALEMLTMTPWYVIPIVWLPLVAYMASVSHNAFGPAIAAFCFVCGIGLWTFFEYAFHRFLFHIDDLMPDHPKLFCIHFLAHGVHHFLPMDHYRLVMPPTLFTILMVPTVKFFNLFVSWELCCAVGSGAIFGYVCYDLCHYFLHHGRPPMEYLRELKTYHLNHHYKNWELGFGITTKFWDRVFGTELFNNPTGIAQLKAE